MGLGFLGFRLYKAWCFSGLGFRVYRAWGFQGLGFIGLMVKLLQTLAGSGFIT